MDLEAIETKSRLANNIVKSLSKEFKLTTDKDQMKFLYLSVYLRALGHEKDAEEISKYIASNCKYDGNHRIWNSVGHQILLWARDQRLKGNKRKNIQLIQKVQELDIVSSTEKKSDYLKELIQEFGGELKFLGEETPKWKCQGYVTMFLELNYCREVAELTQYEEPNEVDKKTEPLMQKLLEMLKQNLK